MPEAHGAVRVDAPAKVNLRLRILARQSTGYHSLETIFCAVSLTDTIHVRSADPGIRLVADGDVDMGRPEHNLSVRAAERFYRELDRPAAVRIELAKRIPAAAGLGGGSSDAAATLLALNALHDEPFPRATLLQMGSELGSDVPFFLCGSPLALAWGRGERLLALPPLPRRPVLIAHPGAGISTAEAFRRIAEERGGDYHSPASVIRGETLSNWAALAPLAENDFEPIAARSIPRISRIKRQMADAGAAVVMLAGSGACVFGIFATEPLRDEAAARLAGSGVSLWSAETLETSPVAGVQPRA